MRKLAVIIFILYLTVDSIGLLCRDCPLPQLQNRENPIVQTHTPADGRGSDVTHSYQCISSLCSYCGHGTSSTRYRLLLERGQNHYSFQKKIKISTFTKKLFRPPKGSPGTSPRRGLNSPGLRNLS